MNFSKEIEAFITNYVKDLNNNSAAIFAGAGLSVPVGFVNWKELLNDLATELGLDINLEDDLISIAQYHVNENGGNKYGIIRKILEEFTQEVKESENHKIIARLPIGSIWTTNYDKLIEQSLKNEKKNIDVKFKEQQLLYTKPKREVVVYKMHGDVSEPGSTTITKEDYEQYFQTHETFINALRGELITKTFLFIGFSFTDPNLDYILSRLHLRHGNEKRQHYCFIKEHKIGDGQNPDEKTFNYNKIKQALFINDLKRFNIKSLLVKEYDDITEVLKEIEFRYNKQSIFISGSAEVYEPYSQKTALGLIHKLAEILIKNDFRIVNGFGYGVGSSIINGALETIYSNPEKYSETQLTIKPFPQFESGKRKLDDLWHEYRDNMISKCGISIFVFGNKNGNKIADGVIKEFELSLSKGLICLPIASTEYASREIYNTILSNPKAYYKQPEKIMPHLEVLADTDSTIDIKLETFQKLLNYLKQS
ncbi:SIR2 family protein [Flavobacterium sp. 140616W15]|uniref:SIR2 family protein n=1 Tax=Flavobacterium sp. 140616W15 TaxID=2478552 RepID=UPI000F0C4863|nr:SIR2 family protein [Flavobacterium sp. 140616W15]AYN03087.1 hypothetical protein EAG11_02040 [Flavobacterium sp. 140616W15]